MMLDSRHIDIDAIIFRVGSHCVVKAATEGSALGVYLCEGAEEIADAVDKVFQVDTCAFVESFISGEEFTVAVLGNEGSMRSSVIKIVPSHEFYDFESKYAQEVRSISVPRPYPKKIPSKPWSLRLLPIRRLSAVAFPQRPHQRRRR